jgi:mediator of RNA polymerase II transcription subunit 13
VSKRSRSEITEVSSHAGKEVTDNIQGTNVQGGVLGAGMKRGL